MTGIQFAIQNLLARAVLKLGIVQRSANAVELDWHQYSRQGELHTACMFESCCYHAVMCQSLLKSNTLDSRFCTMKQASHAVQSHQELQI